jgi:hypothetical protein
VGEKMTNEIKEKVLRELDGEIRSCIEDECIEDEDWIHISDCIQCMGKAIDLTQAGMIKQFKEMIDKLEEPLNRFNLGLDNQEALAYFNGFEDTKKELKSQVEKAK